ncbi:chemotaxis protein CheC [Patulibacter minatonensis]|uniref:chemotaxis protein CheC n=1 Tax=Patulibacter minatonensis TaxID=298163 RepID=UPI0006884C0B|nr:chemotaxis protein CheC [Patulibacter minatonensis]
MSTYSALQLDALREIANIGSGTAGTSLAGMLGRAVDLSVPHVQALPLADAVDAVGDPAGATTAALLPIMGDLDGVILLLFRPDAADTLCRLLGVEPGSEVGLSALSEIGNILGTSYLGAIAAMTGLALEPKPPEVVTDVLGAIVSSVLTHVAGGEDVALVLDTRLRVEDEACALSFLLVPEGDGVQELLARLGLPT